MNILPGMKLENSEKNWIMAVVNAENENMNETIVVIFGCYNLWANEKFKKIKALKYPDVLLNFYNGFKFKVFLWKNAVETILRLLRL